MKRNALSRRSLEALAWESVPAQYRGSFNGMRAVVVYERGAYRLKPLALLSDAALMKMARAAERQEAKTAVNPGRKHPSKKYMKRCETGVRQSGSAYDPGAVCASQWRKMSAAQRRAWSNPFGGERTMPAGPRAMRRQALGVGSRVSALNIRDGRTGRPVHGVFSIMKMFANGDALIRRSDGLEFRVPITNLRSAKNALAPGQSVPIEAITYLDKKSDDKKVVPYEHVFEGKRKPRLHYDGRNLKIKRAGSRYRVTKDWDGDHWIEG